MHMTKQLVFRVQSTYKAVRIFDLPTVISHLYRMTLQQFPLYMILCLRTSRDLIFAPAKGHRKLARLKN